MILASDLLTKVRLKAALTAGQAGFTDTAILDIATDRLQLDLTPILMMLNEDYLLRTDQTALVASQQNYRVPNRAMDGELRHVFLSDTTGRVYDLNRIRAEQTSNLTSTYAVPDRFSLEANQIKLWPIPDSSAATNLTLNATYFFRPSAMTKEINCARVQSVNTTTKQITVLNVPSTLAVNTMVDFVYGDVGSEAIQFNARITAIASTTITLDTLSTSVGAAAPTTTGYLGDWIAPANTSPVPMIPADLHSLLVDMTALEILEDRKDIEGAQMRTARLGQRVNAMMATLSKRVKSKPEFVTSDLFAPRYGAR